MGLWSPLVDYDTFALTHKWVSVVPHDQHGYWRGSCNIHMPIYGNMSLGLRLPHSRTHSPTHAHFSGALGAVKAIALKAIDGLVP